MPPTTGPSSCSGCRAELSRRGAAAGTPCSACSSLCDACKPVPCSFCQAGARLCEVCAGSCDACKRPACADCRATFIACGKCGYAACEDCRLQLQLSSSRRPEHGLLDASGSNGCWCAPPIRLASSLRCVSSQRFHMAALHPSVLARSMAAAGLRDAESDEDGDAGDWLFGGDGDEDEDATTDPLDEHHSPGAEPGGRRRLCDGAGLSAARVEALIGSLPALAGHSLLPLSPGSCSSHSSAMMLAQQHGGPAVFGLRPHHPHHASEQPMPSW